MITRKKGVLVTGRAVTIVAHPVPAAIQLDASVPRGRSGDGQEVSAHSGRFVDAVPAVTG